MEIAFIVSSYDKGESYWDAWYHYFNLNWDNNIKVNKYFLSETKHPNYKDFNVILSNNLHWSNRFIEALNQIPEEYVIIVHEDYWFMRYMSLITFEKIKKYFLDYDMNTLKVSYLNWRYKLEKVDQHLYKFKNDSKWIFNFQYGLWKKDFMLEYIIPNSNVWLAEIEGSKKMYNINHKSYIYNMDWYVNIVDKTALTEYGKFILQTRQFTSNV